MKNTDYRPIKKINSSQELYQFSQILLEKFDFPYSFIDMCNLALEKYKEPWRYYHNQEHLQSLFNNLLSCFNGLTQNEIIKLFLLILFHDVEYKPWRSDNEEKSVEFFKNYAEQLNSSFLSDEIKQFVIDGIEQSKNHDQKGTLISQFNDWDYYSVIEERNATKLFDWERKIFKEFQFVPVSTYLEKRIEFLKNANTESCNYLIEYLENHFEPKVGYFAGSFNPFHIGHLSILQQAEKVYDKVAIAIGQNPEKNNMEDDVINQIKTDIFKKLPGREITPFKGFLTNLLIERNNNENVFLVRGIRNTQDWASESNLLQYFKMLWKDIQVQYFSCPKEIEHVSSSGVRSLEKEEYGSSYSLIPSNVIEENEI